MVAKNKLVAKSATKSANLLNTSKGSVKASIKRIKRPDTATKAKVAKVTERNVTEKLVFDDMKAKIIATGKFGNPYNAGPKADAFTYLTTKARTVGDMVNHASWGKYSGLDRLRYGVRQGVVRVAGVKVSDEQLIGKAAKAAAE